MTEPWRHSEFAALLRRARGGNEAAWAVIYHWLAPEVLGYLRGTRVPDPEDVLGEVFLEVARGVGGFSGEQSAFRAWVFTIARSRRVDEIRRRARRLEERFDTGEHDLIPALLDVETEALSSLVLEDLLAYLQHLTSDQAEVLILRALGGWSSREIAEITGRTIGAVEQLNHRATKALRRIVEYP